MKKTKKKPQPKPKPKPTKKGKHETKSSARKRDVPRRTTRKVSKVQSKPAQPKKRLAGRIRKTQKSDTRIAPAVQKPIRKKKQVSKLKEFLKDIDYTRTLKRQKKSILTEFPELDYLDDLEELLDDDAAQEAEETENSKEMWFAKSHGAYKTIEKKSKKIAKSKGKKHVTKTRTKIKHVAPKRSRVKVHRSDGKVDRRRSKKHPAKRKSGTNRR